MQSKRPAGPSQHSLPPELWICIFQHATHVPGALIPEIYAYASLLGPAHNKTCHSDLREALLTKRTLVRVCKQWWRLAIPFLYQSVYIGRAHCLQSLSRTLEVSATGVGTVVGARPLGEYTQRLDIAIRDRSIDQLVDSWYLAMIIKCMPHLAIFGASRFYYISDAVLDALHFTAPTLRVLDWSLVIIKPSTHQISGLLAKCTQLRVLNCPLFAWFQDFEHSGIPPTVTTLCLNFLQGQVDARHDRFSRFCSDTVLRSGLTALHELALLMHPDPHFWDGLLHVCGPQLVALHLTLSVISRVYMETILTTLVQKCPGLRRLIITSEHFSFTFPNPAFQSITYLGLRVTQSQSLRSDFRKLFTFLETLRWSVPSLRVVRLLNEQNVRCLLKSHTKFAVHALQPFTEVAPFRLEDKDGILLTDRLETFRLENGH